MFQVISFVSQDFVFYTISRAINKRILELSTSNHELYAQRRKPDSIELLQMKAQAQDERKRRLVERLLLLLLLAMGVTDWSAATLRPVSWAQCSVAERCELDQFILVIIHTYITLVR